MGPTKGVATVMNREGLFARTSPLRRAFSEAVALLCAGRALLMQVAHPMVAAGVADHSQYRSDPLGRLERTTSMMMTLVLGDQEEVEAALRRFHQVHAPVRGTLETAAGPFPAGAAYSAKDPALKLWVHATLIDSLLLVHEQFVSPFSGAEREWYYEDSKVLARLFGIPESVIPPTLQAHAEYMERMLNGDVLAITELSREMAYHILHPDVGTLPRAGARVVRFVTAGILPERLREAYGLRWSPRRQAALDAFSASVRGVLPMTPAFIRRPSESRFDWLTEWLVTMAKRTGTARRRPWLTIEVRPPLRQRGYEGRRDRG